MIDQKLITAIKESVDLVALVKSRGVKLRKNGKGYKGPCPFHKDSDPSFSVNPDDNLWNCFGCNKGGDAIRFVELFDHVGFKEAVSRLETGATPKAIKDQAAKPEKSKELAVKDLDPARSVRGKKLLARVVDYYQHIFSEDSRGLDYLKGRGINDHQSLKDFGAGFVNGSLRDILPDDEDVIKTLKELGILNKKGNEIFYEENPGT
jgi:DNA primase catalytic core